MVQSYIWNGNHKTLSLMKLEIIRLLLREQSNKESSKEQKSLTNTFVLTINLLGKVIFFPWILGKLLFLS